MQLPEINSSLVEAQLHGTKLERRSKVTIYAYNCIVSSSPQVVRLTLLRRVSKRSVSETKTGAEPLFFCHLGVEPELELIKGTVPNRFDKLFRKPCAL